MGEVYGPRSGSTVDIPSVLISREAHRENLQGGTATVTTTQSFFGCQNPLWSQRTSLFFCWTAHTICSIKSIFFFLHFSMKSTENYSDTQTSCSPLRSKSFVDWKGLHCFFFGHNHQLFFGASFTFIMNPFSACDDPHPISHLEWLKVAKILNHTTSDLAFSPALFCDLSVWQVPWNARSKAQNRLFVKSQEIDIWEELLSFSFSEL